MTSGDPLVNFSAWYYPLDQLERAKHNHELRPARSTTVNIDLRQRGVGMSVLRESMPSRFVMENECQRF